MVRPSPNLSGLRIARHFLVLLALFYTVLDHRIGADVMIVSLCFVGDAFRTSRVRELDLSGSLLLSHTAAALKEQKPPIARPYDNTFTFLIMVIWVSLSALSVVLTETLLSRVLHGWILLIIVQAAFTAVTVFRYSGTYGVFRYYFEVSNLHLLLKKKSLRRYLVEQFIVIMTLLTVWMWFLQCSLRTPDVFLDIEAGRGGTIMVAVFDAIVLNAFPIVTGRLFALILLTSALRTPSKAIGK